MWVPPSPLGDTTGYSITYNAVGGSSKSVNISGPSMCAGCSSHVVVDLSYSSAFLYAHTVVYTEPWMESVFIYGFR